MKRQVDPGISTEQYRSGVTLTYTCGVARRFQNSTDLYDERYVVKYLNEKFLLNTKGPLSASGTRVGHQASSWIPVSGYSWITLNTICIMYHYISIILVTQPHGIDDQDELNDTINLNNLNDIASYQLIFLV